MMANIDNQQNISIANSSQVSVGGIQNTISTELIDNSSHNEILQVFIALQEIIDALPNGVNKSVAQNAVEALEQEASKGAEAQESEIRKWLNFLFETAPDAWEVAIDTFIHPIKGLSTVFQKVAEYAKSQKNRI